VKHLRETFSNNNINKNKRKGKRKKIWGKRYKRRGAGFRDLGSPRKAGARKGDITPYFYIYNVLFL